MENLFFHNPFFFLFFRSCRTKTNHFWKISRSKWLPCLVFCTNSIIDFISLLISPFIEMDHYFLMICDIFLEVEKQIFSQHLVSLFFKSLYSIVVCLGRLNLIKINCLSFNGFCNSLFNISTRLYKFYFSISTIDRKSILKQLKKDNFIL